MHSFELWNQLNFQSSWIKPHTQTRPTTAKIEVEIDITRTLPHEVQIDIKNEKGQMETIIQKVEYETILEYCNHCKRTR